MVSDERYCIDILHQAQAVKAALATWRARVRRKQCPRRHAQIGRRGRDDGRPPSPVTGQPALCGKETAVDRVYAAGAIGRIRTCQERSDIGDLIIGAVAPHGNQAAEALARERWVVRRGLLLD